jgi:Fic family protein
MLALIGAQPDGARADQLETALKASRASLNRRLRALRQSGRVAVDGRGPATRYRITAPAVVPTRAAAVTGEIVPLSTAAARVRGYLRDPVAVRRPAGYRREFLDRYQPNATWYLPDGLRRKLRELGTTAEGRPAGTYARDILDRLLIDLSWASSHLEGNTYSLLDTKQLIEDGLRAEGKSADEATMILNHKRAIEFLVENAADLGFSRAMVTNLHACLAEGLVRDPAAIGAIRRTLVAIEGTPYVPPQVPQQIEELFEQLIAKATAIEDPFEQAFFAMVQLPYLQPFIDINKRTSRLAANIPLVRHNLVPLSFVDVTERDYVDGVLGVYELTDVALLRDVFEWAYERSATRYLAVRDALGIPDPFRMRYRAELYAAVRALVTGTAKTPAEAVAGQNIPAVDRDALTGLVINELSALHDGNYGRFGLTPRQFQHWKTGTKA